ncbi:hypothetical protein F383_36659 [Gossypium arboreum]|uniref:Uncharacterized protein n=1 Tax=Gossypium arboreum TaxID=29729 RepID=A0A0B0M9B9_GOSAR|nr:hypothetical protein F383_36659 [Gossypium arboreum]
MACIGWIIFCNAGFLVYVYI